MEIKFKFGSTPDSPPTKLELGAMTVLVGPNGAGKTLTLMELCATTPRARSYYSGTDTDSEASSIASVHFGSPRPSLEARLTAELRAAVMSEVEQLFRRERMSPHELAALSFPKPYHRLLRSVDQHRSKWMDKQRFGVSEDLVFLELMSYIKRLPRTTVDEVSAHLLTAGLIEPSHFLPIKSAHHCLENRLSALDDAVSHSLQKSPQNILMTLIMRRDLLARVNAFVHEAFGFYLDIDATALTSLRAIVVDDHPWSQDGLPPLPVGEGNPFATARPLADQSSGVRLFISTIVQVIVSECDIILIDEPETCLHPPLARRLGTILTTLAEERGLSIIVATHSPDFLAGCVSTRHPVSICRLDYRDGIGRAHAVDPETVISMINRPRFRAAGLLDALFHEATLVCEGAPDRALYGDINQRLLHHEPKTYPQRMSDCLFLEFGGMKAMPEVLGMLRQCGVLCGLMYDRDVLFDEGVYKSTLSALGIPEDEVAEMIAAFREIVALFPGKKTDPKGVEHLSDERQATVRGWLDRLASHGIFVSDRGELEDWLPNLGVAFGKPKWTPAVLDMLGPIDTGPYLPTPDDIWGFLRRIAMYVDHGFNPVKELEAAS